MSIAVLPAPSTGFVPGPPRWTCDEFHRLWDRGLLEGKWVILVDGEMLAMPAPSDAHDLVLALVTDWASTVFPRAQYWVRGQMGMVLSSNTDPIPDVVVIAGPARSHKGKPRTALLVVEVADTSFDYDTGDKASLYAAAGVPDYWVVDSVNLRLYVFRNPIPDAGRKYGHWYGSVTAHGPADTVAPLAAPAGAVAVGELLP